MTKATAICPGAKNAEHSVSGSRVLAAGFFSEILNCSELDSTWRKRIKYVAVSEYNSGIRVYRNSSIQKFEHVFNTHDNSTICLRLVSDEYT